MSKIKPSTLFKELIDFIRLRVCLFITGIGITGYIIFNPVGVKIFWAAASTFFISATAYSYNLMTDKKEDLLNHKKINAFVLNRKGYALISVFMIIGLISTLQLSYMSLFFYLLLLVVGLVYSYFRIKNIFPFKNLYTGFVLSIVFFIGSTANSYLSISMVNYYLLISLHIFTISLISDLRDYAGDRETNLRTLPVVLGYSLVKKLIYLLLSLFAFLTLLTESIFLYPLMPFITPIAIYLRKDRPGTAHLWEMISFMLLPFGIIILS